MSETKSERNIRPRSRSDEQKLERSTGSRRNAADDDSAMMQQLINCIARLEAEVSKKEQYVAEINGKHNTLLKFYDTMGEHLENLHNHFADEKQITARQYKARELELQYNSKMLKTDVLLERREGQHLILRESYNLGGLAIAEHILKGNKLRNEMAQDDLKGSRSEVGDRQRRLAQLCAEIKQKKKNLAVARFNMRCLGNDLTKRDVPISELMQKLEDMKNEIQQTNDDTD